MDRQTVFTQSGWWWGGRGVEGEGVERVFELRLVAAGAAAQADNLSIDPGISAGHGSSPAGRAPVLWRGEMISANTRPQDCQFATGEPAM